MMGSIRSLNPMARYAAITAPTLVVHSALDPIPWEWSQLLADTIPDADFVLLDGASHFPMVEDAEQLRTAVLPWISKHGS